MAYADALWDYGDASGLEHVPAVWINSKIREDGLPECKDEWRTLIDEAIENQLT